MTNNGFTPSCEFYAAYNGKIGYDNKAMVTPLPSGGHQPSVRINLTETDKSTAAQAAPTRSKFRNTCRVPHTINAVLGVIVISAIILLELGFIPAIRSGFHCKDPTLSHKYTGDTIRTAFLLLGSLIIVPFAVLFLIEYLRKEPASRICYREIWFFYKEFFTGCALVLLLTEILKNLVGEHRPHFFDSCQPNTADNCTAGQYIPSYQCKESKFSRMFMADLSKSFPSGHASLSCFVSVFYSYIIQTRLPTMQTGRVFKPFLISVVLTWALVCSFSRITDKRHHWWDVGVGMLMGILTAFYSLGVIHRELRQSGIPRVATSTTTLLDVKNKNAKSEII
ncbi:phospholipid phosphatase 3-like isoform X3 [Anthonomus grandis grandis]|uniref:phospholipid phosphatase 3-like isoform X3 n=1 Tax=Anthonomus grandis grandis TaxID=2921223 RepID=UPI002164FAA2|nr:phospholipid phosphatase 3-like isoform X3 [Anthonomus grandis grandis]